MGLETKGISKSGSKDAERFAAYFHEMMMQAQQEEKSKALKKEVTREQRLKELFDSFSVSKEDLKIGDIVYWKEGLKNKKYPKYGEPGIVVEVLNTPFLSTTPDSGSSDFREDLSIKIGIVLDDERGEDARFVCFYFDKFRFTTVRPISKPHESNDISYKIDIGPKGIKSLLS